MIVFIVGLQSAADIEGLLAANVPVAAALTFLTPAPFALTHRGELSPLPGRPGAAAAAVVSSGGAGGGSIAAGGGGGRGSARRGDVGVSVAADVRDGVPEGVLSLTIDVRERHSEEVITLTGAPPYIPIFSADPLTPAFSLLPAGSALNTLAGSDVGRPEAISDVRSSRPGQPTRARKRAVPVAAGCGA